MKCRGRRENKRSKGQSDSVENRAEDEMTDAGGNQRREQQQQQQQPQQQQQARKVESIGADDGSDESELRRKMRKVENTEADHSSEDHRRDGDTGEPGEKRLRREGGESRGTVERGVDVDAPAEERHRRELRPVATKMDPM